MWPLVLIVAAVIAGGVFLATSSFSLPSIFGTKTERTNTQVINAVNREQQVVLVSLGIQGIAEEANSNIVFDWVVPGSGRAKLMVYTFKAKLGIEGGDVEIVETSDGSYLITIPDFMFIGHDDAHYRVASENNGILSWFTPEVSEAEMINNILTDEVKDDYVDQNLEILRDQAKVFYTGIVSGIDPEATLEFEFAQ